MAMGPGTWDPDVWPTETWPLLTWPEYGAGMGGITWGLLRLTHLRTTAGIVVMAERHAKPTYTVFDLSGQRYGPK